MFSGVKGKMTAKANFQCSKCTIGDPDDTTELKELPIGNTDKVECVDRFCYLGDMIGDGGGAEEASRARVRCAWSKFMELAPILTLRGASLRLKGKIYKICVQRVLVYVSETWATKADDIQRLQRAMVRWMCGVKLKDRRSNRELLDRLHVVEIGTVVSRGRLGWYDHVERMPKEKWVSKCRELEVEGDKGKGNGKNTWRQGVEEDRKRLWLDRRDVQDNARQSGGISGNCPTSTCAEKTLNL